ncbi:MAG: Mth938-like domain-containing protein [Alphaproteobacteria bacterium]|jgi:uncharacterized protein|nr:Mth938-like domain-containing protein [Alphaproteobacteria bacterium]MDP6814066.1 Mth938-like domain-containing protein [Alphaproteobacteria bacterium]
MDITPPIAADRQFIQGYGGGGFRISGVRHEGSVLVLPEQTLAWPIAAANEITRESLKPFRQAAGEVAILLLGCGSGAAIIDPELRQQIRDWGAVIEAMGTGAACRTYNVLLTEERAVAAALIAVE